MHSPLRNLQAHAFVGSFETASPNTRHIPNCLGYGFGKANSRQPKGKKVQNDYYIASRSTVYCIWYMSLCPCNNTHKTHTTKWKVITQRNKPKNNYEILIRICDERHPIKTFL